VPGPLFGVKGRGKDPWADGSARTEVKEP